MVNDILANVFAGFFDSISGMLKIIYVIILALLFFFIEGLFIYLYIKLGKFIKNQIPKFKTWFDLNKDRFSGLLDRK